jgi:hypothetical protein
VVRAISKTMKTYNTGRIVKGPMAGSPQQPLSSIATNTLLVPQGHVRERAGTLLALRKNKFFINVHFQVNWKNTKYLQKIDI